MQNNLKALGMVFLAYFFLLGKVTAGNIEISQKIQGAAIQEGAQATVKNNVIFPGSSSVSYSYKVALIFDRAKGSDLETASNWTFSLTYNISYYDANYSLIGTPVTGQSLTVQFDKTNPENALYQAMQVYEGTPHNYSFATLTVVTKSSTAPDDVRIELTQVATTNQMMIKKPLVGRDGKKIYWSYVEGAEYYQLEWVFIDKNQETLPSTLAGAFDMKEPVRISTDKQYFELNPTYPEGKIYYRVRGMGKYTGSAQAATIEKEGVWQDGPDQIIIDATNLTAAVVPFEEDKNWQYVTSYAEDGKFKKAMSFYDGSMRNRQSLATMNSDTTVLVGETKYDYEGRASVNVLPYPVHGNDLKYKEDANVFTTSSVGKKAYDYQYANGPAGLSTANGASKYYSSANNVETLHRDYIPDAQGYPYSQVQYMKDGTGRISRQSVPGEMFKLKDTDNSPHYTRYIYSTPAATELQRLFGTNVGNAKYYRKTVTVDPNGQKSVSYTDQYGRVIATALKGKNPSNLNALPSKGDYDVVLDLMENNIIDESNRTSITQYEIANGDEPITYTFNYSLKGMILKDPLYTSACVGCEYDLEIKFKDPDNNEIPDSRISVNGISAASLNCSDNNYTAPAIPQRELTFSKEGVYTITKKLTVSAGMLTTLANEFYEQTGLPQLETYVNTALSLIDYSQCDVTCEQHCRAKVFEVHPSWNPEDEDWDEVDHTNDINNAVAICVNTDCAPQVDNILEQVANDACASILQQMKDQVSPGGKYYDNTASGSYFNTVIYPAAFPSSVPSLADVKDETKFTAAWADQLVQYHPEYCHYGYCQAEKNSTVFDDRMAIVKDWTSAGTAGYLDPLSIDPYFAGGSHSTQKTALQNYMNNYFDANGLTSFKTSGMDYNHDNVWDIWDFVNSYLPYSTTPGYPITDTEKWRLFRSMYMGQKMKQIASVRVAGGCHYLTDEDAVVMSPLLPTTMEATDALNDKKMAESCDGLCPVNVQNWLASIQSSCGTLTDVQRGNIQVLLQNYCSSNCGYENPLGIVVKGTVKADPNLVAVQYLLDSYYGMQCSKIDEIIGMENPYTCSPHVIETRRLTSCAYDVISAIKSMINNQKSPDTYLASCPANPNAWLEGQLAANHYTEGNVYSAFFKTNKDCNISCTNEYFLIRDDRRSTANGTDGFRFIWGSIAANYTYYGACAPATQYMSLEDCTPNHVYQLQFYKIVSGSMVYFDKTKIVDISMPYIDHQYSYGGNTWDNQTVYGVMVDLTMLLPNGETEVVPAYLATNYGPPFITWKTDPETEGGTTLCVVDGFTTCQPSLNRPGSIPGFGHEIQMNGGFDNKSGWFWGNSRAYPSVISDAYLFDSKLRITNAGEYHSNAVLQVGKRYRVSFDILTNNNSSSFKVLEYNDGDGTYASPVYTASALGLHTFEFVATRTGLLLKSDFEYSIVIDNFSIHEVLQCGATEATASLSVPELSYKGSELLKNGYFEQNGVDWYDINNNLINNYYVKFNTAAACQDRYIGIDNKGFLALADTLGGLRTGNILTVGKQYELTFQPNCIASSWTVQNGSTMIASGLPATCNSLKTIQFMANDTYLSFPGVPFCTNMMEYAGYTVSQVSLREIVPATCFNVLEDGAPLLSSCIPYTTDAATTLGNIVTALNLASTDYVFSSDGTTLNIIGKTGTADALNGKTISLVNQSGSDYEYIGQTMLVGGKPEGKCCTDLFSLEIDWEVQRQQCITDLRATATFTATQQWKDAMNELLSAYISRNIDRCLIDPYKETFKVSYRNNEYHYTLYYYDAAGNLVHTVPPEGVNPLTDAAFPGGVYNGSDPVHHLVTTYKYNSIAQTVSQNTPDAGSSYFFYDSKGQLRLSQNSKQKEESTHTSGSNVYSYTRYDEQGRTVEVGEMTDFNRDVDYITTKANQKELYAKLDESAFPSAPYNLREYTTTVFDQGTVSQQNLRGRVAKTSIYKDQSSSPDASSLFSYDIQGNVNILVQQVDGLADKTIEYSYDLISRKMNKVVYQPGQTDLFIHKYEHDADNRLKGVFTSSDNKIWEEDARYFFYKHGPMARIELGEDKVQGLDYFYTLEGRLKAANTPNGRWNHLVTADPGKDGMKMSNSNQVNRFIAQDEFAYSLAYYNGDYLPINNSINLGAASNALWSSELQNGILQNGLYNGNISSMTTQVHSLSTLVNPSATNDEFGLKANAYQYDQLNRLTHARSYDYSANSFGASWASRSNTINTHASDASYSYDANGNISSATVNYNSATPADNLQYDYTKASGFLLNNRLNRVQDLASPSVENDDIETQGSGNYTYDDNGNLKADASEQIANIKWSAYGKIKEIIRTTGSTKDNLEFKYDALGNRVVKIVKPAGSTSSSWNYTYYLRDASGNIMAIYTKTGSGALDAGEFSVLGSSRLGVYYRPAANTFAYRKPTSKKYELSNHLGNVYITISGLKLGSDTTGDGKADYYKANVLSANDYHAFGSEISGRSKSSVSNRYGFQNQETERELWGGQASFFKYRISDNRLGRFFSVDPLESKFPHNSPYAFSENRLIDGIEFEGKEVLMVGISGSASIAIWTKNYEGGLLFAPDGIFTYVSTGSGYESDIGVAVKGSVTFFPNMPKASDAAGTGYSIGWSAGVAPLTGGFNYVSSGDDLLNPNYEGINIQFGVGASALPLSGTYSKSNTTIMKIWSFTDQQVNEIRPALTDAKNRLVDEKAKKQKDREGIVLQNRELGAKNSALQKQYNSSKDNNVKNNLKKQMDTNNEKINSNQEQINRYDKDIKKVDQAIEGIDEILNR